jgi:hypothetical protein
LEVGDRRDSRATDEPYLYISTTHSTTSYNTDRTYRTIRTATTAMMRMMPIAKHPRIPNNPDGDHCDDEDDADSKTPSDEGRFPSARLGPLGASKLLGGGLVNKSRGIPCALKKCAARTKWGKEVDGARLRGSRWWPCQ